jgi:hypothetical protein
MTTVISNANTPGIQQFERVVVLEALVMMAQSVLILWFFNV